MNRFKYFMYGSKFWNKQRRVMYYYGNHKGDGAFFKDEKAFATGKGICYIPSRNMGSFREAMAWITKEDHSYMSEGYISRFIREQSRLAGMTRADFINLAGGDTDLAKMVFDICLGQNPWNVAKRITFTGDDIRSKNLKLLRVECPYLLDGMIRKGVTDSLLLGSGMEVCYGKVRNVEVSVKTQGRVHLVWKGRDYHFRNDFPKELVEILRNPANPKYKKLEIIENNWFEEFVEMDGKLVSATVIDYEPDSDTESDLVEYVKDTAREHLKAQPGDVISIIRMDDKDGTDKQAADYNGAIGYVTFIDDAGQIHGSWGGLALIPEVDKYKIM